MPRPMEDAEKTNKRKRYKRNRLKWGWSQGGLGTAIVDLGCFPCLHCIILLFLSYWYMCITIPYIKNTISKHFRSKLAIKEVLLGNQSLEL